MFLEVLSSIAYKNNILGWCINTFSDRVAFEPPFLFCKFGRGEIYLPVFWRGIWMRQRRTSLLRGVLYPPVLWSDLPACFVAGSDVLSNISSHFLPLPDLRNCSRNLADLWLVNNSVCITVNLPISWPAFEWWQRCSLRRRDRSLVIPTYRLPAFPFKTYKVISSWFWGW